MTILSHILIDAWMTYAHLENPVGSLFLKIELNGRGVSVPVKKLNVSRFFSADKAKVKYLKVRYRTEKEIFMDISPSDVVKAT